jgi:hypothetical protein
VGVDTPNRNEHRLRFSDESPILNLQFAICNLQSASLICALAFAVNVLLATVSPAAELQWRSPRATVKKVSKPAVAPRFTKPRSSQKRVDIVVRQAAFELEEEGPQLPAAAEGEAELKSVIVDRPDPFESDRSAQLPQSATGAENSGTGDQPAADSQLEEQLRDPFGQAPPQLPGIDTPDTGEPATGTPAESQAQPPMPEDAQQQPRTQLPFDSAPNQFQPNVQAEGEPGEVVPEFVPAPSAATLEKEREETEEACEDSMAKLRAKTIDSVNISIAVTGTEGQDFPFECTLDPNDWHAGRAWPETTYLWKASALCHKPLYFEDEQLERYGHSWPPCCQPFVSGAHFFTRLPILPYCMGVEPPHECIYSLGHYRPGSCAPYMCNPIPISPRGALFQAGAAVGAAAVLP